MTLSILGLDGATWDLLDPLMSHGVMPHLARLTSAGARAPLLSTFPPVTALAWPTFYTGLNAGRHGVFSFLQRHNSGSEHIVSAHSVRAPTLWDYASAAGLRVGVVGAPLTYPARPVNGFLISDFLTPPNAADACYPAGLLAELERQHGPWVFHVPPVEGAPTLATTRSFISTLIDATARRLDAVNTLLDRFQPDLFLSVWMNTDAIQHTYWGYLHPGHPYYHRPEAPAMRELLLPAFRQLDDIIASLAARALPGGNLLVMSDHGFGPMHRRIALNNALQQHGFLAFRQRALRLARVQNRLRRHLRKLSGGRWGQRPAFNVNQRQSQYIDWAATQAFAGVTEEFGIFLNRSDRFSHGIVSPAAAEPLLQALTQTLLGLRDPEGKPLIARVQRREAVYHGPYVDQAPDLLVWPADERDVFTDGLLRGDRLFRTEIDHPRGWHRPAGILIAAGQGIRPGASCDSTPSLLDMAPTVFALLGLTPPSEFEGRVLSELLVNDATDASAVVTLDAMPVAQGELSTADEAALSERLRGLGYL